MENNKIEFNNINRDIGVNSYRGAFYGGIISSYSDELTNDNVICISSGLDKIHCKIGDFSDAYDMLKEKIKGYSQLSLENIGDVVFDTVWQYFGGIDNINERLKYFPDIDDEEELGIGTLSSLKGKNVAMCVERASLAHNLFKSLNINSTLKFLEIKIDGKYDCHAFNLVENNNKFFIFDSTLRRKVGDKFGPIFIEIPKDYYLQLMKPNPSDASKISYSLDVIFDGVNNKREVIYSPDKENVLSEDLYSHHIKK